jgi:hypothetical protein
MAGVIRIKRDAVCCSLAQLIQARRNEYKTYIDMLNRHDRNAANREWQLLHRDGYADSPPLTVATYRWPLPTQRPPIRTMATLTARRTATTTMGTTTTTATRR